MNQAEQMRINALTLKFFRTAPSKFNAAFTKEEIAILKAAGVIHRPCSRKMTEDEAQITGAAYTKLSR